MALLSSPLTKKPFFAPFLFRRRGVFFYLLSQAWWPALFVLICTLVYFHAMRRKESELKALEVKWQDLQKEKQLILEKKEDLMLQIQSQSDPSWVELTLMRKLGLIPEGQSKVYFEKDEK